MPAIGGASFSGEAIGIEITARYWVLELVGTAQLPSTARAVILRPKVPQGTNPSILQLDLIPVGDSGSTDVISDFRVAYADIGFGRLVIKNIEIFYGGESIATIEVAEPRRAEIL